MIREKDYLLGAGMAFETWTKLFRMGDDLAAYVVLDPLCKNCISGQRVDVNCQRRLGDNND